MAISEDIKKILRDAILTVYDEKDWGCEDFVIGVNAILKNDVNAIELIEFIDNNKGINSDDVCYKALDIVGELDEIFEKSAD